LSAVRGVAGDGNASGGRAQHGGVGYDPGPGEFGVLAEYGGVGEFAGQCGAVGERGRFRPRPGGQALSQGGVTGESRLSFAVILHGHSSVWAFFVIIYS
jgi:hypothetical protein